MAAAFHPSPTEGIMVRSGASACVPGADDLWAWRISCWAGHFQIAAVPAVSWGACCCSSAALTICCDLPQALGADPAPPAPARPDLPADELAAAKKLAGQVTIYRDRYGVPHVDGASDEAAMFGFAYAQAEDYFWQIEDSYILSLGRYAEVHGTRGLNSDLLNRAFEIVPKTQAGLSSRPTPRLQTPCEAFAAGLNYYLATHPEVRTALAHAFRALARDGLWPAHAAWS